MLARASARGSSPRPLDEHQKRYLRPHFGNLVDNVVVFYNVPPLDDWQILGMTVNNSHTDAQTFCERIFVNGQYNSTNRNQLVLLAHELKHSQQCQQFGGLERFGYEYFRAYKRANLNYDNISLEQEAYAFDARFEEWLNAQLSPNSASSSSSSPVFDSDFYLMSYGDLRNAFGTSQGAAKNHWLTYGIKEGRRSSPAFDVQYYLSLYPDLQNAFGSSNYSSAIDHWLTYGIKEGRRSSTVFDVKYYLNKYPDLQNAFGSNNYSAAVNHWLTYGVSEGRQGSPDFDPKFYLSNNPDVAKVYGVNNYKGAIEHYLEYGKGEGRRGTP